MAAALFGSSACAGRIPETAMDSGAMHREKPLVQGTLITNVKQAARGSTFRAGVLFNMAPGWHIYWRNPGDAGMPTRLIWFAEGASFGKQSWPIPKVNRDEQAKMTTYEYGGQTLITVPVTVEPVHKGERLNLKVRVNLLACKQACIPGSITMSRYVAVGKDQEALPREERWTFQRFKGHLPRPAGRLGYAQRWKLIPDDNREPEKIRLQGELACTVDGACMRLASPGPARRLDSFLPLSGQLESVRVESIQIIKGGLGVKLLLAAEVDPEGKSPQVRFKGIFSLLDSGGAPVALEVGGKVARPDGSNDT